jgi:dihydrofolate reductase
VRKVVLYTLMSLDGAVDDPARYFIADRGPGGPPEFDAEMEEAEARLIEAQDVVLLGRQMYEEWSRFWPTVENQPFADFINSVKKYVVTSKPLPTTWPNSEAVAWPVEELVGDLKTRPGGDIGIHGSIRLAQSLLGAGLVDELQLLVAPAVGFPGRRLFENADQVRRLELVSSAPTSTGSLLLSYRVP